MRGDFASRSQSPEGPGVEKTMGWRVVVAGLLGGLVLFGWGGISWMALPLHIWTIKSFPNDDELIKTIRDSGETGGFYTFPGLPHEEGWSEEERQIAINAWEKKLREGPVGFVVFSAAGQAPMDPVMLGAGFIIQAIASIVAACLLFIARRDLRRYFSRVFFVTLLGLFAFLVGPLVEWNYWGYPLDFILMVGVDLLVGWFLCGLVLARFIKA
jgi:hypothetical protein